MTFQQGNSEEFRFAERERERILDRYPKDAWLQEHVKMLFSAAYAAGAYEMGESINTRHGLWKD